MIFLEGNSCSRYLVQQPEGMSNEQAVEEVKKVINSYSVFQLDSFKDEVRVIWNRLQKAGWKRVHFATINTEDCIG
jgi:hypothetical protein